jgi:hypothetical protein
MLGKKIIGFSLLLLALAACGDQTPPPEKKPPGEVGEAPAAAPPKVCTEPPKTCPGGAVPSVDPGTCAQSCPGE